MSGVNIYCPACKEVEHLSPLDTERLINGLLAALADAECEPDGDRIYAGDDSTTHLDDTCVIGQLSQLCDTEVYYEHIESVIESRRALEQEAQR